MSETAVVQGTDGSSEVEALPRFRLAFEKLLPELEAIPESELVTVNLEVQAGIGTVFALMPGIRARRAEVAKVVHADFDLSGFDRLEEYALALGHTHGLFLWAGQPLRTPDALTEEALEARGLLASDAEALSRRKLLNKAQVDAIRGRSGHRNLGYDLLAWVGLFREHWPSIAGRTATSLEEIEGFELLADRLIAALTEKERSDLKLSKAAELRKRAFTAFIRAYDDVRRLVTFARWKEKDADKIAPSLYALLNKPRGGATKEMEDDDTTDPVVEPELFTPSSAPLAAPASAVSAVTAVAPVKEGLPGGSPFDDSFEEKKK